MLQIIVETETEIKTERLVTPEGSSDVPTDENQDSDENPDMPIARFSPNS